MSALGTLAIVTVLVSSASLIPQLRRVLRTRVTDGLSAGTIGLTLVSYTLWLAYGVGISDPTQMANNSFGLVAFLVLAHVVARETGLLRSWHAPAIIAATAAGAAALTFASSPVAVVAVGTALGFFTKLPQVRVALSGQSLLGLCPWALLLGQLSSVLWLAYGIAASDMGVVVASVIGSALQAVIVYRRLPPRRTLDSLARGRLGARVSVLAVPVAARFPHVQAPARA